MDDNFTNDNRLSLEEKLKDLKVEIKFYSSFFLIPIVYLICIFTVLNVLAK